MDLTTAIDVATTDYRAAVGEPEFTARECVAALRRDRRHSFLDVMDWSDDGAIDARTAEAYHDVLDATPGQLDAALMALRA